MQDKTPAPTNPDVYVHSTPAATFFVLQYGGFGVDDVTISTKAASLASKLRARGEDFVEGVFFTGAAHAPHQHACMWLCLAHLSIYPCRLHDSLPPAGGK